MIGDRLVLLDLDGVLCDDRHRVHHALNRDWGSYFGQLHLDAVWPQGRLLYESCQAAGWDIAYLTGRREDNRERTVDWLQRHGFDHTRPLVMRPIFERRRLADLKAAFVGLLVNQYERVILHDDDPEVVAKVNEVEGARAVQTTWYIKPNRMIKRGQA